MIIDAHQHFWMLGKFDTRWLEVPRHRPICRSFLPVDLRPLLDSAGVDHSIFVQTQHNLEENRWALDLADQYPFLCGVVGWIDLASEQCEDQLLEFRQHPKFVGVRHIVQDEPNADFIIQPEVLRGLRVLEKHGVPFDLLFYVKHLKHVPRLARELPQLKMVIDHLAKPQIKLKKQADWEADFRAAAAFPNVYCKLSGMVTEADWHSWKPADLKPYVQVALNAFGAHRLMFGSDWPVSALAASYSQVLGALRECLVGQGLRPDDLDRIYSGTAIEFYQLPLSAA